MPPKKPEQTQFPSFAAARGVFAGNRGGKGNLAAAGTASTGTRNVQRAELASAWIRSQVLCQLKARPVANTHEEEGYVQALLADADWFHRLGTPRFSRCLQEVLRRAEIDNIPIDKVTTEPL